MSEADVRRFESEILSRLDDWRGMLRRHPQGARQMLTKLLAGRITFTPRDEHGERYYEFSAPCSFDKVIRSGLLPIRGVTRHAEV